jgi:hypothetical protein
MQLLSNDWQLNDCELRVLSDTNIKRDYVAKIAAT